ncbi:MAG: beta-propeller domain-containing protein [Clostridia bacterium]
MKKISIILCVLVLVVTVSVSMQQINVGFSMTDDNNTVMGNGQQSANQDEIITARLKNAIVLYVGSPKAYVDNQQKEIDDVNAEVSPISKDNRTLVPVRFISESMGAKVDWDEKTSEITVTLGEKNIQMTLGSENIKVNNKSAMLEVAAQAVNGRTVVPLRALAESLGKKVFYDRGLIIISDSEIPFNPNTDKDLLDEIIARVNVLPTVGTYEKLADLMDESGKYSRLRYGNKEMAKTAALDGAAGSKSEAKSEQTAAFNVKSKSEDYSTTNTQVQGVDEADIVKTDGEYIYQVNKQRIVIAKAYPANEMKVVGTLSYDGENFNPIELYLDDKHLVVIGSAYKEVLPVNTDTEAKRIGIYRPERFSSVKAVIYDISDKENIKNIREVELDGYYVTSRKIGTALYFITNKYLDYYYIQEQPEQAMPQYRDTVLSNESISIDYKDIQYIPRFENPNYLIIAGLDLGKTEEKVKVSTYLGAGENAYVSQDNMYIALTSYSMDMNDTILPDVYRPVYNQLNTLVYKFALNNGKITYLNKGEVPGTVLNQFSMDETGKYFRIATTTNTSNSLYVLDDTVNIIGRLEDIAPGEKIYSVRFMGNRAYMVTFKTVDPLFVIDLKDPQKPSVLGALKIPGYSDYLHPYDENHIIGFGKDTVEIPYKDHNGNVIRTTAFYKGMKMAMFDVSDVTNPIEKFTEFIGDRGTESELLKNHKALLFSKEKNLLAFPVTLMEVKDGKNVDMQGIPQYGQFTFQGAYVYRIDMNSGFDLRGKITHLTGEDYKKAGNHWYDSERNVERMLYIDDTLYTLSEQMIKAHSLDELQEKNAITIP